METATADFYGQRAGLFFKISLQVLSPLDEFGLLKKFLSFGLMVQLQWHTEKERVSNLGELVDVCYHPWALLPVQVGNTNAFKLQHCAYFASVIRLDTCNHLKSCC